MSNTPNPTGGSSASSLPSPEKVSLPAWLASPAKARKSKAPSFWDPQNMPTLRFAHGDALSGEQMEALRRLFKTIKKEDVVPAEIEELKSVCDPLSLDQFGDALIDAWFDAETPSKEKWALWSGLLLVNPTPSTMEAVHHEFFKDKVWFPYGQLKVFPGKKLGGRISPRGARAVSSFSSKVDFLVQAGITPPADHPLCIHYASKYPNMILLGEKDFLRAFRGKPVALPTRTTQNKNNEGLEDLRALLHHNGDFLQTWDNVCKALDDMSPEMLPLAVDYVQSHLDAQDEETQKQAIAPNPWLQELKQGKNSLKFSVLRSIKAQAMKGKETELFLTCTHLNRLEHFTGYFPAKYWVQFASLPRFQNLKTLDLTYGKLHGKAAAALANPVFSKNITALSMRGVTLSRGGENLFPPGSWPSLQSLDATYLTEQGQFFKGLADGTHLTLHTLKCSLHGPHLEAFFQAPHIARLTHLVADRYGTQDGMMALSRAQKLTHLKTLRADKLQRINGSPSNDDLQDMIWSAPHFAHLAQHQDASE